MSESIEQRDVGRAIAELAAALHLARVRLDRQVQAAVRRADERNACRTAVLPRRETRRWRFRRARTG